jgi:hypothetical protein
MVLADLRLSVLLYRRAHLFAIVDDGLRYLLWMRWPSQAAGAASRDVAKLQKSTPAPTAASQVRSGQARHDSVVTVDEFHIAKREPIPAPQNVTRRAIGSPLIKGTLVDVYLNRS